MFGALAERLGPTNMEEGMIMLRHRAGLRSVSLALLGLALTFGCSTDHRANTGQRLLGVSGLHATAENGLTLTADPMTIVIDPNNPETPTDPNHGNERYGRSVLHVAATDANGAPQPLLEVTFATSAGVLTSGAEPLKTDAAGLVTDTLTVYESDPDLIHVSVTDGTRLTKLDVTKIVAAPPVANAGPDQTVPCTGGASAQVTLDAGASTDPNNDITLYEWFEHFGTPEQVLLDKGKSVEVVLPLGEHVITLRVTDATGNTSTDEVVVNVVDTSPPVVELNVTPSSLWPPNHKLVHVTATVDVHECQPFTVTLESVTSNEPDNGQGDGDTSGDIQGADLGNADYDFDLRAERAGGGSGRVYTITYRIVDAGGLATTATAHVSVPHDQGKR